MKKAILLFACNRPNYLWLGLTGLKECRGIEQWDIIVSVDGGGSSLADCADCQLLFPSARFIIRDTNLGNRDHCARALLEVINEGYDAVYFSDEDILNRPDTLTYLDGFVDGNEPDAMFCSTWGGFGDLTDFNYTSPANLIRRQHFDEYRKFASWVESRPKNVPDGLHPNEFLDLNPFFDAWLWNWCFNHKILNRHPPFCYGRHFGFAGLNLSNREYEQEVFSGPKQTWFYNLLNWAKDHRDFGKIWTSFDYEGSPKMGLLLIQAEYGRRLHIPNPLSDHMDVLRDYASRFPRIVEFGVDVCTSTVCFLSANPQRLYSYDIVRRDEVTMVEGWVKDSDIEFKFILGSSLKVKIPKSDLLFVDSLHTYGHLYQELNQHCGKIKSFILIHDTTIFGDVDPWGGKPGLWAAVEDFLEIHPVWKVAKRFTEGSGLTVLERIAN